MCLQHGFLNNLSPVLRSDSQGKKKKDSFQDIIYCTWEPKISSGDENTFHQDLAAKCSYSSNGYWQSKLKRF